jgi:tyrosine-specific transport protein
MNKNFFYATATLIGVVVGVGIFGVPYVVAKSGFLIGLLFLFGLGGVALLHHLFYGEIVLRTPGKHRYVGYAEIYLGGWGKRLITFTSVFIFYGALLAYIIVGGKFLATIFGGSDFIWSLIFFTICSLAILFGLRVVAKIELLMGLFLILIVVLIFIKGWPEIKLTHLSTLNWSYFFLPYGVILWAVTGGSAIPEMKEIFKQNYQSFKKAIIWGTLLPVFLYGLFILTVVGVTGQQTSPEAIKGLVKVLENHTVIFGAIFGLLAVITSFLVVGLSLKKTFWYDYKVNKHLAWALTCFIPFIAYLCHLRDFITVIGFLGATLAGLQMILLILIYQRAKKTGQRQPEYSLKLPSIVCYGLILILGLGVIYQIVSKIL